MRGASWLRTPAPPKVPRRGVWPRQKPAPDSLRCEAITAKGSNAGQRCYNSWSMQFGGVNYCERHHPVRRAECDAWRIHREIAKVEAMGFVVRPAPTTTEG